MAKVGHESLSTRDVVGAFRVAAAEARLMSPFRLRWMQRRLERQRDDEVLDHAGLARLAAVRRELRDRGLLA